MSGDTTVQALKRLTFLPERDSSDNGNLIAGQDYFDVLFTGGVISNVDLQDVTITLTSPLPVNSGGTGVTSFTANSILKGNGTGSLQASGILIDASNNITGSGNITLPNTGLRLLDTNASHSLIVSPGSDITANRTLSIVTGDADRTFTLTGNFSGSGTFSGTSSGTNTGNQTTTGTTNRISVSNGSTSPVIDIDAAYVGQTTITTLGNVTAGTWNGTAIAATKGGTGQTTTAVGDLLVGGATNTFNKLSAVATGSVLLSQGVATAPAWGQVNLASSVTGTLPVANGGTGVATTTAYGVLCGGTTATGPFQNVGAGTSTYVLTSSGAGVIPTWQPPSTVTRTEYIKTAYNTNTAYTQAHGLSVATIKSVEVWLECTTADNGYAVGDRIEGPWGSAQSFGAYLNATTVACVTAGTTVAYPPKTGGAWTNITPTSWRVIIVILS